MLCEKEKLFSTSNFSFSHSDFKQLLLYTSRNQGLFGKGLTAKVTSWRSVTYTCRDQSKGLVKSNTHMKYESSITYYSKVKANVTAF